MEEEKTPNATEEVTEVTTEVPTEVADEICPVAVIMRVIRDVEFDKLVEMIAEEKGYRTISSVAEMVGVSRQTIYRWSHRDAEGNKVTPTAWKFLRAIIDLPDRPKKPKRKEKA